MKKTIKAITAVMVVLTLCLGLLAGCGSSPVGTWKITSAEAMGVTVDPAEMGMDDSTSTMTLNADGTITAGSETGGSWTLDGNVLTISESGVSMEFEYTGSEIIMDMGFAKVTYTRA